MAVLLHTLCSRVTPPTVLRQLLANPASHFIESAHDGIVPLGEAHLRRAITEFVQHYHCERNHQGIDNALIVASEVVNGTGRVVRRDQLGGLLGFYHRAAA
jgi:hypothetical protein